MKQKRTKSNIYALLLILPVAWLTACSQEVAIDNKLPENKYPMEFSATVAGLSVTRGTADDGQWAGGEEVAVKVDEEVKQYQAIAGGTLTSDDPFYWQLSSETKTVSAWYPHSVSLPTTFDVEQDQSAIGYQASDFLYAVPTDILFSGDKKLTFKHLTAKITVNLKKDKSFTESDDAITNATVTFLNQNLTSGTIEASDGSVAQQTTGGTEITPKAITLTATDYLKTIQVLLVPQQRTAMRFIKITVATTPTRDYYYIPASLDLAAGTQYTYNITVGETLTVTVPDLSWTDDNTDTGDYEATEPVTPAP